MLSKTHGARSKVVCDALLLDERSGSDTYPTMRISDDDEQLFYLMSHGYPRRGGRKADRQRIRRAERNRLIELQMEGSVG